MDAVEVGLRLVGAFYVFAGHVATRAALSSHVMDKALAALSGKGPTPVERAISIWHVSAATLVMASGLALILLLDLSVWLFLASALGQALYIYVVAPRWFDVEDPPSPEGRQQTTNAFVIYSAVTALVAWAAFKGKLMPFDDIDWPWLAAAGAALAANIISILRTLVWSPKRLGAPHDPT